MVRDPFALGKFLKGREAKLGEAFLERLVGLGIPVKSCFVMESCDGYLFGGMKIVVELLGIDGMEKRTIEHNVLLHCIEGANQFRSAFDETFQQIKQKYETNLQHHPH